MHIYFAGLTRSTLFDHRIINQLGEIAEFCQISLPALTDIEIGKGYLLLWESEKLLYSSGPSRHMGYASMQVKLPNPAANEHCKLVTPHYGKHIISILTTNNVFWEYDIDKNDWKQINIFTPKSSEHAVKIIHIHVFNLLLTNLGRLFTMHDHQEIIQPNVKFIDIAHSQKNIILLGDDNNVYVMRLRNYDSRIGSTGAHLIGPYLIRLLFKQKIVQIAAGEGHYTAITEQGHLYTWGSNHFGELGINSNDESRPNPQLIKFQNNDINIEVKIKKVECGNHFTMCLTDDGTFWGTGKNIYYYVGFEDNILECKTFVKLDTQSLGGETVKDFKCNEYGAAIFTE